VVHESVRTLTPDGNVRSRQDTLAGRAETFTYDRADRLQLWTAVTGAGTERVERRVRHDYSAGGRLLSVRDRERVGSGAFTLAGQETYLYDGVRGAGPRAATELVSTRGASTST
jgi:hypothetical protein